MRNFFYRLLHKVYLIEGRELSYGRVELWKTIGFYQVRYFGETFEESRCERDIMTAVELYNSYK